MKCSKAARMLQRYVEGQLTAERARVLKMHVESCPCCREELLLLEEIEKSLNALPLIAEPEDLTANIMRRVAASPRVNYERTREQQRFLLFRPSFSEILAAIVLATVAMLGIALEQPAIRVAVLPLIDGHDFVSILLNGIGSSLGTANNGTLMLGLWVVGTLLGVWITLALAGSDMRNAWFRAMADRFSIW